MINLHVAVGIILNKKGEVLIAQRLKHQTYAGFWEFPGGKIEPTETVFSALKRELQEEIGIDILSADPWFQIHYTYPDRIVLLDNWLIKEFSGEPHGAEGQLTRWIHPNQLSEFEFPEANREIINRLIVGFV